VRPVPFIGMLGIFFVVLGGLAFFFDRKYKFILLNIPKQLATQMFAVFQAHLGMRRTNFLEETMTFELLFFELPRD
jgi:cell shape-determining protein MreD